MSTVPIACLDDANDELAKAMLAVRAARDILGEHWIANSHLAEAFSDLYHARQGIGAEKKGRIRAGERNG